MVAEALFLPNTPYPPQRHPLDHHFTWSKGRVLHAYQIVYISDGGGWFQSGSASSKRLRIDAGSVFLLFPNVWHRYAPDMKTGWTEHWLECTGQAFSQARRRKGIQPSKPVIRVGVNRELIDAFDLCHRWARRSRPARASALATLGLHLLAVLEDTEKSSGPTSHGEQIAQLAQLYISEHFQKNLKITELADALNVGYSHLRQSFKACTGLSPKQFHLQIRLQHARDLLANTDKSIKEIATLLGFDSPYHFSAQFKRRFRRAPKYWRSSVT